MPLVFDNSFIDVSVHILAKITGNLPFDVYIRRAANTYTKIFPKNEPVDMERLTHFYQDKGVESWSVNQPDYRQYLMYAEKVAASFLQKPDQIPPNEMADMVKEMASLTWLEISSQSQIDQRSAVYAIETIQGCVASLAHNPKTFIDIMRRISSHPYLIKHSLAVSILALLLAKHENLESKKTLMIIGLSGLLHDIGITRLSFDPDTRGDLTPTEWKELKEHPQLGKRMLEPVKQIPAEVRLIIFQHHEQPNGAGYPNGLRDKEIYFPAKFISIADSFSSLVSDRGHRKNVPPARALELMMEERGKFDPKLLDHFVDMFVSVKA